LWHENCGIPAYNSVSLRRKILVLIGLTMVALVIGMYAIASRILLEGFGWIEERDARKNVQRALHALADELGGLRAKAADWAVWDDACQFVEDGNAEFIKSNCADPTFVDLRLDLMLYLNREGKIVYQKGFDTANQKEQPVSPQFLAELKPGSPLLKLPEVNSLQSGIMLLPEGVLMVVARPVVTSQRTGPIRGTVIFGRYLDQDELAELQKRTQLSMTLVRTDREEIPVDFQQARAELTGRTRMHLALVDQNTMGGYTAWRDIYGKRALLIRINIPRDIYGQGRITISYLVSTLLVVGLVIGVLAIVLLEGLVLARLGRVIGSVRAIGASGNLSARLPVSQANDELSSLTVAINRLLEAVEKSHHDLSESQRQLATLMGNLPGMVYRCRNDQHWTMEFVSDGCRRLTGCRPEALLHNQQIAFGQLIHPEDRQRVWDTIQAAVKAKQPFTTSYRLRPINGEDRYVWAAGAGVFDAEGRLTALEGYIGDVTEHRRTEAQLRLQSAALESAANAIVITNRKGEIIWVNSAFVELTGYSAAETVGHTPSILKSGKHDAGFYSEMWRTVSAGNVWRGEIINRRKDGRLYTERMIITPVRDALGSIGHFVAIKEDITEHRRLQEQFLQAQKMEAVGRLAGGVAHDFNNMLTAIMGYSELMLRDLKEDSPLRRNASEIERAAYRAAKLTRQLLAFSRKQVLQPKVLDLNQVFANMEKMLRRLVPENIELRNQPERSLGRVKADPSQIEQVILNLVINARDAMPQGGTLTVTTANVTLAEPRNELPAGEYVMLAVTDSGAGISEEAQQHLFEPFFTTKAQNEGTGLGLATCYGIVKQSGGDILVETAPGRGSTFRVCLPREMASAPQPPGRDQVAMPTGSEHILLVEDEEAVRDLAEIVLKDLGYKVTVARNGLEALHAANQLNGGKLDLLLTDMVMPHMDGRDLAEALWARRPTLRVLFCSGYTQEAIVQNGSLGTGVAFLQKPYTTGTLARKVREVLDRA